MPEKRPLNVFISYASQDVAIARKLYAALQKETWLKVWFDKEELLPGMDWDLEIYKALRAADVILPCFSEESVAKEGYVQKEFKRALDYAEEKPDGTIYVIPLRLDNCIPPRKFNQWQWVDYFDNGTHEKLLKSLKLRATKLEINNTNRKKSVLTGVNPPIPDDYDTLFLRDNQPRPIGKTSGGHPIYTFGQMDFVKVPAGEFFMGANDITYNEKPEHLVYLDYDFYMARFPVTNRQYARLIGSVAVGREKIDHPIVNVSWYEAQKFITMLDTRYRKDLPQGWQFRLPSEAEWEKAARGAYGNIYPWGDEYGKGKCNSGKVGIGLTTPVGVYSPQGDSPYGCADMAGNVWEWTRSLWGDDYKYPYRFDDGRENEGAADFVDRVLRGGTFSLDQGNVRCAFRIRDYPGIRSLDVGFRIVVSPSLS